MEKNDNKSKMFMLPEETIQKIKRLAKALRMTESAFIETLVDAVDEVSVSVTWKHTNRFRDED